ncbi:putative TonB-dependent receptor [Caenibius tardaugens NBRC 16725]|uniref:Putative TonB-dependent receptor n=1 Tax=Caenibius tardaugens NBRC 16725 TaxID=1219035 RepID=U2ZZW6_9SPHN|nr:TonB-dependent receptor [Caenibius tardaugens]GAD50924.1 putative TonB-dependent receptor [Caenibius tardaugens NBRC 16725]
MCLAPSAYAQERETANSGGLADIVVTARRTSESLQKTPISITALNAEALEKINVTQVDKVAQVAPNVVISQQSGALSAASINIRGIGQTDPSFALDTAVGIYMDGVYVARTAGSIFDLVDLERIEVLRGPQGTLFGRNTTGGAIQLITKKPTDEFGVTLKGGYGSRDSRHIRARIDTGKIGGSPISASLVLFHRARDGYFDNHLTSDRKDPGSLNVYAFMGALRGDFGPLQIDYSYDYDKRTGAPAFFQIVGMTDAALAYYSGSQALGGAPLQLFDPDKRARSGLQAPSANGSFMGKTVGQGHNLTISYEVSPAITFKSITGYRKLYMGNALGLTGNGVLKGYAPDLSVQTVVPYNGVNAPMRQRQFSQELQLLGAAGDFKYVLGAYFFDEKATEDNKQELTFIFPNPVPGPIPYVGLNLAPEAKYHARSKSYAVFGQLSWRPQALDEKFELTGGIRYTKDKKRMTLENTSFGIPDPTNGTDTVSFDNISFLASASYQFTPDVLGYAKFSTGYKSGGFNPRAPGLTDVSGNFAGLNAFKPEKLTSYEVGLKTDFFDRRLRVNVAAFYSNYKDLQVAQFASGSGGASTLLVNAGKAEFKGVELEITALPVRGLTLTGSLGYTDPKYKQFLFLDPMTNEVSDISGTARFSNLAKFNSYVSAEYAFEPMAIGQLSIRGSYAYRSHVYFYPNDAVNIFNKVVDSNATNSVEARISLSDIPLGNQLRGEISLFGENLLNEDQALYGVDFGGLGFGGKIFGEPRRFGVDAKLSF